MTFIGHLAADEVRRALAVFRRRLEKAADDVLGATCICGARVFPADIIEHERNEHAAGELVHARLLDDTCLCPAGDAGAFSTVFRDLVTCPVCRHSLAARAALPTAPTPGTEQPS